MTLAPYMSTKPVRAVPIKACDDKLGVNTVSVGIRHCERSEAISIRRAATTRLLRYARNDETPSKRDQPLIF